MLGYWRPPEQYSLEWPLGEDLIIPQFRHELLEHHVSVLSTPPPGIELESIHLIWFADTEHKCYRMIRILQDGTRHGEVMTEEGVHTGIFTTCECCYCNAVKPIPFQITDKEIVSG